MCSEPFQTLYNCSIALRVELSDVTAKITKNGFYINGAYNADMTYYGRTLTIKKSSSLFYSIDGPKFRILYNPGEHLYIKIDPSYQKKVNYFLISNLLIKYYFYNYRRKITK